MKPIKSLSSRAIDTMKSGDKDQSDLAENRGLRIFCGATGVKTFDYRYTSPITGKSVQIKIGNHPQLSLANARVQLQTLKQIRQ